MRRHLLLLFFLVAAVATPALSQEVDIAARNARWKQFNTYNFDKLDYSKAKLTRLKIAKLKEDENADDYALLRGVIFGKRGGSSRRFNDPHPACGHGVRILRQSSQT